MDNPVIWMSAPFLMVLGHIAGDWLLQPPGLAMFKRSDIWWRRWQALGCHGAVHGFFVALVLGPVFGLAEAIAHACIDRAKGRRWIGTEGDQVLHFACKVLWLWLAL